MVCHRLGSRCEDGEGLGGTDCSYIRVMIQKDEIINITMNVLTWKSIAVTVCWDIDGIVTHSSEVGSVVSRCNLRKGVISKDELNY
jgi:hypothetical protein